mmetsp:Transcript_9584/g.30714  ORF Transcript_9584/g.30714 Transcript_9584/m.30714 type:complete len:125 (+) Transcript_9584:1-375(+)
MAERAAFTGQTVTMVMRPHLENSFPGYLASKEAVDDSLASEAAGLWRLGARVRRRYCGGGGFWGSEGTVVGFRYPVDSAYLPWAAVVVEWDIICPAELLDTTLDMPRFCTLQHNVWELELVQSV